MKLSAIAVVIKTLGTDDSIDEIIVAVQGHLGEWSQNGRSKLVPVLGSSQSDIVWSVEDHQGLATVIVLPVLVTKVMLSKGPSMVHHNDFVVSRFGTLEILGQILELFPIDTGFA